MAVPEHHILFPLRLRTLERPKRLVVHAIHRLGEGQALGTIYYGVPFILAVVKIDLKHVAESS